MKTISTTRKITMGFVELRKRGYFAEEKFWCCQTCGVHAVPEDKEDKYVFYHEQDAESIKGTKLVKPLYLAWNGSGEEIEKVFQDVGLATEWDGKQTTRIAILP